LDRGYEYVVSNSTPDAGYEVFRLSGDGGVRFTDALLPVTISLKVPKSVVKNYEIGAGFPSQAPIDWIVMLYDQEDIKIGVDDQNGVSFLEGEVREFPVRPTASVSKVVLTIAEVPLNVTRDIIATRVDKQGVIEVVPPNTP
jgi:hypothetical protein